MIDDIIAPLMGDVIRHIGWMLPGSVEPRFGTFLQYRRWKPHNGFRQPKCGLFIWSPNTNDRNFLDYPGGSDWSGSDSAYRKKLTAAGKALTAILRHNGPKPFKQGGYWLGSDSGGWVMIADFLTNLTERFHMRADLVGQHEHTQGHQQPLLDMPT